MPSPDEVVGGVFQTRLGKVVALTSERGLRVVSFDLEDLADAEQGDHPTLNAFGNWLNAYFAGDFHALPRLPLDLPKGPTEIWEAVRALPVGHTRTYGGIAQQVGRPRAARAVGAAMARNPILLVIPCHRVVAASGSLQGYAAGIERKAWLLRHEGALLL